MLHCRNQRYKRERYLLSAFKRGSLNQEKPYQQLEQQLLPSPLPPPNTMDFASIVQEAANIKSAQSKKDRQKFDSWPDYLKFSLFYADKAAEWRENDTVDDRLRAAEAALQGGHDAMKNRDYAAAMEQLQCGISQLVYVTCRGNWRKGDLTDENLTIHRVSGATKAQEAAIAAMKEQFYLAIAAAALNLQEFKVTKAAAADALQCNADSHTAFYLRAQANILPVSSGATEMAAALKDLQCAAALDPNNKEYQKALMKLRWELKIQSESDKKQFGGMFERGSLGIHEEEAAKQREKPLQQPKAATAEEAEALRREKAAELQLRQLESLVTQWKSEGRHEAAAELQSHIHKIKAGMARRGNDLEFDFHNPTPEMIAKAKEMK